MLATGNSSVGACAFCLVSAMQREIPFARSKGIDPDVYDVAANEVGTFLDQTARSAIGAYEPRVKVDDIDLDFSQITDEEGTYFTATISDNDEDINEDSEGDDE